MVRNICLDKGAQENGDMYVYIEKSGMLYIPVRPTHVKAKQ